MFCQKKLCYCLKGIERKVFANRFCHFRSLLPSYTCGYAFSLHSLSLSTSVRILIFKEDMTEIYFANSLQSKNYKQRYKIKNSYRKFSIQNNKKSPGIEFALSNRTRETGIDSFCCLNSSLFYFISVS